MAIWRRRGPWRSPPWTTPGARAELLSLAAVRALAAADRIVAAEGCAPEVLAFARRDAERRQTATAADLAAWAGEGLTVLYVSRASTQAVLEAVRALGVAVERLPVATPEP
jgi:siroheme synthase